MTTVPSLNAVGLKFPDRYIGIVINTLMTATNIGPISLILTYNYIFMKDGSYELQDIRGFFLSLAMFFLVVNCFAVVVYKIPLEDEDISESTNLLSPQQHQTRGGDNSGLEIADEMNQHVLNDLGSHGNSGENLHQTHVYTLKEVLRSPRLHLTVWPAGILIALKFIGISNISTILNAYGLSKYEANSPFIQPAGSLLFKPLIGFLSDYTKEYFSRAWYLIAAVVVFIFWLIVAIYAWDNFAVFCVVLIMWGVASDAAYVQPGIFMDEFGKEHLGMNMSFLMCTIAFSVFIPQAWFSAIYKAHSGPEGLCYGNQCFTLSLILDVIVTAACGLCFCCYLCLRLKERQDWNRKVWKAKGYW